MFDIVLGVLAVGLPLLFVGAIVWSESGFKWSGVLGYLVAFGLPSVVILFWNPFTNLTEWQMAVFGLFFALALVGIHHLIEHGKR